MVGWVDVHGWQRVSGSVTVDMHGWLGGRAWLAACFRVGDGAAVDAGEPGERGRALPHGGRGGSPVQGGGGSPALQDPLQAPGAAAAGRIHQSQGGQSLVRPLIIIIVMTVLIPSEDGVRLPTGRVHQSQGGQSLARPLIIIIVMTVLIPSEDVVRLPSVCVCVCETERETE